MALGYGTTHGERCAPVAPLPLAEEARFDAARLEALYRDLGAAEAEDRIGRAMRELGVRLDRLDGAAPEAGGRIARRMVGIAEEIGLTTLARAARQMADAAAGPNLAARDATFARLMRVGEDSLLSAWTLEGARP